MARRVAGVIKVVVLSASSYAGLRASADRWCWAWHFACEDALKWHHVSICVASFGTSGAEAASLCFLHCQNLEFEAFGLRN